jgi:hypothetical protein
MRGISIDDLPLKYRKQVEEQLAHKTRVPSPAPDVEPHHSDALVGPQETQGYHGPTRIVIIEKRHRLTDYGGGSEKYLVDALVSAKILLDDNTAIVKKIRKDQVKIPSDQAEETIVEIWKENSNEK